VLLCDALIQASVEEQSFRGRNTCESSSTVPFKKKSPSNFNLASIFTKGMHIELQGWEYPKSELYINIGKSLN